MDFEMAKKAGFSDAECYFQKGKSFDVRIFKGEVAQYKNAYSQGLCFRGTYGGNMGYASTEKTDDDVLNFLIKSARENAENIEEEEQERLYPGDTHYPSDPNSYNHALDAVSVSEKIAMAKELEKVAYSLDKRVVSVDYCILGNGSGELNLSNSLGLNLAHKKNIAYAYVNARVEEAGMVKTAGETWYGKHFDQFSPEELARAAVEKAVSYLNAKRIKTGCYPVVINNRMAIQLFSVYVGNFFAEKVQKGFSLLKGRLGESIASTSVTLRDDGICERSMGSTSFDSEGVATQNKVLIENGRLLQYLHNTKSAAKDNVRPTGNGFKAGFSGTIGTAATNFYVMPSLSTSQQLLEEMQTGVLITELTGLHAGTNPISGEFSLSASGFWVEGGQLRHALEQMTMAGNFYTLLKQIDMVGNDLYFDMPTSGGTIGMPSMLVRDLDFSGV